MDYSREECNEMLLDFGFYKKKSVDEEVPEVYKTGPYIPIRDDIEDKKYTTRYEAQVIKAKGEKQEDEDPQTDDDITKISDEL